LRQTGVENNQRTVAVSLKEEEVEEKKGTSRKEGW